MCSFVVGLNYDNNTVSRATLPREPQADWTCLRKWQNYYMAHFSTLSTKTVGYEVNSKPIQCKGDVATERIPTNTPNVIT